MTEANLALYRKYRPSTFSEVCGQEHITAVLEEALKGGNITHSYLFHGSRGTGKTSVARILAHELGVVPEDLYEIDAASNRGIDDVRELREAVRTLPFRSPYKVYIVDEVHMLTKEAFNALLKTLEEPPPHVVFVLATTELSKLPDTIVSRCQTFTFKKPSQVLLSEVVLSVAKKEGNTLTKEAAHLIALLGDGSFRDTLGVLQKVLHSTKEKNLTEEDVSQITSAPSGVLVRDVVSALVEKNLEDALGAVARAEEESVNFTLFSKLILEELRRVLLFRFAPDLKKRIQEELAKEHAEFLEDASRKGKNINSETLLVFLDAVRDTDRAYIPSLPLELALIKLLGDKESS
jgi:DNA polymerase III subunit gamma/tau